ncbi:MAG: TonB-dependent receptor [Planctomycetes bacterium]|nr:TonB-dependent receptor [Planctomycetota bacterium]
MQVGFRSFHGLRALPPSAPPALAALACRFTLAALVLAGAAASVGAQDAPVEPGSDAPRTRLPEVTVTATRAEQEVFEVPYTAQTLDAEFLGGVKLARTVPEALAETPGVAVQKTSRGQGSPFLRGFTGFRTLFLIDGIRLNNSVFREGPNQYWGTIDPLTIERLEVVKGSGSVLYGSDAVGGTVNAITRERMPVEEGFVWERRLWVRAASADRSLSERAELAGNFDGRLGFLAGAAARDFGDLRAGNHLGRLPNTDYRERDGDLKLTWRFAPHHRLVAAYQEFRMDDAPRTHRTDRSDLWHGTSRGTDAKLDFDQRRRLAYLQWHWGGEGDRAGPFDHVLASVSWQRQEEEQFQIAANRRRTFQGFEVDTPAAFAQVRRTIAGLELTAGGEYYHDEVSSFRKDPDEPNVLKRIRPRGPVADDTEYDLAGGFLQARLPLGKSLEITAAGRYSYAAIDARTVDPDPLAAPVIGPIEDDFSNVSGGVRVLVRPIEDHLHLYAGVSQAFRAPNVSDATSFDIAGSGDLETPSPGLEPEEYVTVEVGAKVRALGGRLETGLSYFFTDIDGMLVRTPTGVRIGNLTEVVRANVGDGWMKGVEFEARWQATDQVALFGNFAWTEGEVDQFGNPPDATLRRLPLSKVPPATGLLGVRYEPLAGRWWVEALAQFAGEQDQLAPGDERDTQRIPPGGSPGYTVYTLRGGYRVSEGLSATLALENLTDKDYRVHGSGLNESGFNAIASVDWRF